jgi:GH43 family beta-xylosidase
MLKHKEIYWIGALLSLGALAGGCASGKQVSSTAVTNQAVWDQPGSSQKTAHHKAKQYVVKPHDCLWIIAGKQSIYGDPFEWPMLFKANRDLIKDPDLIYAKQTLKVEEGLTPAEVKRARDLADSTPKYQPHDKPRETQMTEYF